MKNSSGRFVSLRVKFLVGFTAVFGLVFTGAYYWFYTVATERAMWRLQEDLVDTLEGAISQIDGDQFARLARLELAPGETLPTRNSLYQEHQAWLYKIHVIKPRAAPYTFIKGKKPYEVLWIGDSLRFIQPAKATVFREPYDSSHGKLYQGLTRVTVRLDPYRDVWGQWVSAYGPIRNSAGQIVGGMGVDFNANYVYEMQQAIRDRLLVALLVTYAVLFVLFYVLSDYLTRHLSELTQFAEAMATGNYHASFYFKGQHRFQDEMDTLAQVFAGMADNIRHREAALQELNAELEARVQERTATLSQVNQDLDAQARQLKTSLNEKELLLKEVHHRVKNNLQIISSLLSLQAQQVRDPHVIVALSESINRVRSIALIHENLYQSTNLARIDCTNYINTLTRNLFASYKVSCYVVRLKLDISNITLGIDSAIPCGLLINELVSNSLKHAFPHNKAGEITVKLLPQPEGYLSLIVRDTGVGLPAELNIHETESLGLSLISGLTQQLSGQLAMYNDRGTIVKITFPLPKDIDLN